MDSQLDDNKSCINSPDGSYRVTHKNQPFYRMDKRIKSEGK